MKKKIQKIMEVSVEVCDICQQEMPETQWNEKRIEMVRHLFKTAEWNAHEKCINKIVLKAFKPYFK